MKKYIRDMSYEEIAERLEKGEKALEEIEKGYYLFDDIMKIINYYDYHGSLSYINVNLPTKRPIYFEVEEPFEIKETGLYKTRDGRKAFVSYIDESAIGILENDCRIRNWEINGNYDDKDKTEFDILSKWK